MKEKHFHLQRELKALGVNVNLNNERRRSTRLTENANFLIDEPDEQEEFFGEYVLDMDIIEEMNEMDMMPELGLFSAVESDYREPKTYKQMLKRPEDEKNKWLEGCKEEFNNIDTRKV